MRRLKVSFGGLGRRPRAGLPPGVGSGADILPSFSNRSLLRFNVKTPYMQWIVKAPLPRGFPLGLQRTHSTASLSFKMHDGCDHRSREQKPQGERGRLRTGRAARPRSAGTSDSDRRRFFARLHARAAELGIYASVSTKPSPTSVSGSRRHQPEMSDNVFAARAMERKGDPKAS
jgi:hypothetical protein